jgi:transcriptional regulator with XRE-family HTH domain
MTDSRAMADVARNVRAARTQKGLSLDKLAERAGVSKGALVALESATANPNLGTLVRLADALGQSVSALLAETEARVVRTAAAGDSAPLWTGAQGGEAHLLLTTGQTPVEFWRWTLKSDETYESHPHGAGTVETVTVLSGKLVLILDGVEHSVPKGTTATYDADVAHSYRGAGRSGCELLMTVHLPAKA